MMGAYHSGTQPQGTAGPAIGSALRIDPTVGINDLRAGRRCISTSRNRAADDRATYDGPTRRPAGDARVAHGRQRSSDASLGSRDKPSVDRAVAAPEQSSGKASSGCDEQDCFA